jgi:dihydroxy-acid dehydratase
MSLNKYSARVTQPRSQGASQAMLYGIGLTHADLQRAQVGICSMWYEGNTCNMHLDRLAAEAKVGVEAAGLVGLRFNTIGVSDGLSMGTDGMSYSSGTTRSSPCPGATRTCRAASWRWRASTARR